MSKSKEIALDDKENAFIEALMKNGGRLQDAAEAAGYNPMYGYKLRDRLASHIVDASKQYMAMNSLKASFKMVDSIDSDNPLSPLQQAAARDVLDRSGVKHKDDTMVVAVKANIFILPDKKPIQVIDTTFEEVKDD